MNNDQQINEQIGTLADHLLSRRDSILKNWRHAVDEDPALTSASTLARKEFYDHIPAVLDAFDQMLRARYLSEKAEAAQEQKEQAAEHGLHRWHHGYNQRDVMREWSHLHIVLVNELENYSELSPGIESGGAMSIARRALAELCSNGVNESAMRYAELQQVEAAARIQDLEQALESLSELDRKRVETWRRAVHDVRGSFGVIKNIADQLHDEDADEVLKTEFLTLLQKSVVVIARPFEQSIGLIETGSRARTARCATDRRRLDSERVKRVLSTLGSGTGAVSARSGTVVLAGARGRDQYSAYRAKFDLERAQIYQRRRCDDRLGSARNRGTASLGFFRTGHRPGISERR